VALLGIGWGLGRRTLLRQVFGDADAGGYLPRAFAVWIRWVVPAAMALTLVLYLSDIFG